ncbi:hypothetical protein DEO72_LG7g1151 [Vigna unguiculata]|uniref:Aminotransferase-like n=1 Tax=Vigna unguiculata TaxID=3917 RepID=A0A4D6MJH9_VIGUN|nr:hypothetical protein DEO72_LG7g1151 [Vigna unguiculata]
MQQPLKICNPLLLELLKCWLPAHESFHVMQRSIPFTCADICMSLGLSVVGLDVDFDKTLCGIVGGLLQDKIVTVETVIEIIQGLVGSDSNEVDNVFRLYIFVCFAVLYFSRNSKTISNIPCSVLDDIDGLSNYNWGKAVHSFLVKSLSRRILALGQRELCLSGAAPVLQICGEWRLREEDKQNNMIREALQLGDEAKSEKSHVDIKLASTKVLLQRLRTHRTRLRMMKDEMTLMRKEISLRCHGGIDTGVQHG